MSLVKRFSFMILAGALLIESTWSPQPKEEKSAKVLNPTLMGTETDNNETRRSTLSDVLFAIAQFTHIENRKYLESLREALSRLPKLPSVPQNISKLLCGKKKKHYGGKHCQHPAYYALSVNFSDMDGIQRCICVSPSPGIIND
ncbi:hypothetical protein SK128_027597 [Halocaridina rubra]|uniref:Uncharacterized protein n=1 Tax=Halocaridina rubra TaxID=373956 RepID=A0AAN8WM72_HALRR